MRRSRKDQRDQVIADMANLIPVVTEAAQPGHVVTDDDIVACHTLRDLEPQWRSLRLGGEATMPYFAADATAAALIAFDTVSDGMTELYGQWRDDRTQFRDTDVESGTAFLTAYGIALTTYKDQDWFGPRLARTLQVEMDDLRADLAADISRYVTQRYAYAATDLTAFQELYVVMGDRRLRNLKLQPDWHPEWDDWVFIHEPRPTLGDLVYVPWRNDHEQFLEWVAWALNHRSVKAARKLLLFADSATTRDSTYELPPELYWPLFVLVKGDMRPDGDI